MWPDGANASLEWLETASRGWLTSGERIRAPRHARRGGQVTSIPFGRRKEPGDFADHRLPTIRARCSVSDPGDRHAMPMLASIESCRQARSSGVVCAKIIHIKWTFATSNSVNVSATRAIDPHQNACQCPYPPALRTNTLLALGPRTWTIASAVAVIAHDQRPPTSHATTSGPIGITKPDVAPVTPSIR